jgi:Rrf2 family protein
MMIAIARESREAHVSLGRIAKQTKISRRYLDQLAHGLKRVALIRGLSGRRGGYQLTRPAEEITLAEIIDAAIGPINIVDCVRQPDVCINSDICKCRRVYSVVNDRIEEVLRQITLAELAEPQPLHLTHELTPRRPSPCQTQPAGESTP